MLCRPLSVAGKTSTRENKPKLTIMPVLTAIPRPQYVFGTMSPKPTLRKVIAISHMEFNRLACSSSWNLSWRKNENLVRQATNSSWTLKIYGRWISSKRVKFDFRGDRNSSLTDDDKPQQVGSLDSNKVSSFNKNCWIVVDIFHPHSLGKRQKLSLQIYCRLGELCTKRWGVLTFENLSYLRFIMFTFLRWLALIDDFLSYWVSQCSNLSSF